MRGRGRYEVSTTGVDENLQLVGGNPYRTRSTVGIRVPTLPTGPRNRYLIMLAFARIAVSQRIRVVAMRQMATLGAYVDGGAGALYLQEQQITSPWWAFPDGNISWHLKRVAPGNNMGPHNGNREGMAYRYAMGSAILFEKPGAPIDGKGYVAPYGGIPPGSSLMSEYDGFKDTRSPWQTPIPLDLEVEGPCDIVLFASVKQTSAADRQNPPPVQTTTGVATEDSFVSNNPSAVYWRVSGSLIFEDIPSSFELRPPQLDGPARVEPRIGPWLPEPR